MPWRPGDREAALTLEQPYEDVPNHLAQPLWGWIESLLQRSPLVVKTVGVHMRVPLPDAEAYDAERYAAIVALRTRASAESGFMLDTIEYLLKLDVATLSDKVKLGALLTVGNSIYTVREDQRGLELRVLPEVKTQVQAIVDAASGSPGVHLATAWSEAYGRTADPVKAYSEAIKAVEAAAAPVISPNNAKATLGTLIADLKAKPTKWQFTIKPPGVDGVEETLHLMSLLWGGQTSRHGGNTPTVPETPEAAQAAVHVAATLVQFFVGGAFSVCQ